jgi:hypothetical protein
MYLAYNERIILKMQAVYKGYPSKGGEKYDYQYVIFLLLVEGVDHLKLPNGQFLGGARMRNGTCPEAPGGGGGLLRQPLLNQISLQSGRLIFIGKL